MKTLTKISASVITAGMLAAPLVAAAQPITPRAGGQAAVRSASAATSTADRLQKERSKAVDAITKRLSDLDAILIKISDMKYVSSGLILSMQNLVQTEKTNLSTLKSKIDGDTSTTTLREDAASITKSFRIYALVIPQAHIAAAADRVKTVGAMLNAMADKISARLQQMTNKDVASLQKTLADLKAKIADAEKQADTATTATSGLQPDGGDKATMESNNAALKAGRGDIKTAQSDIQAARKDLTQLLKGIKGLGTMGAATSSASTSTVGTSTKR